MATVTIEGSLTPCSELRTGERRTVQLTERVQRLIDRGFVVLVKTAAPRRPVGKPVQSAADVPYRAGEPAWSASRDEWAAFVIANGQLVVAADMKGDIIHRWQARTGGF